MAYPVHHATIGAFGHLDPSDTEMNHFLIILLTILIGTYLLDAMVNSLNVRNAETELPAEFAGWYDAEKYGKSQQYLRETTRFSILKDSILTPATVAFILLGGFNLADRFARGFDMGTIVTGLIFSGVLLLASHLVNIPFTVYKTFVIEERYGFNTTTPRTFITDIVKAWVLTALIGGIILSFVLWFFEKAGPWAWVWCWLFVIGFQVLLSLIAPVVIMPLFNKFEPLKAGDLRDAIEAYAGVRKFKMRGIFTMDGSRRSTKSNAFFTGFGRFRRIVLLDTLLDHHPVEEVVSVLAHEMGHYKKRHVLKLVLLSVMITGLMFFLLSLFINNRDLFEAFGMERTSVYASLFFFGFLFTPVQMILSVFTNLLSRTHEYAADAYAVETYGKPEAMISALKRLSVKNLSNLTPHPLKVLLDYSHPPVLERIKTVRSLHLS